MAQLHAQLERTRGTCTLKHSREPRAGDTCVAQRAPAGGACAGGGGLPRGPRAGAGLQPRAHRGVRGCVCVDVGMDSVNLVTINSGSNSRSQKCRRVKLNKEEVKAATQFIHAPPPGAHRHHERHHLLLGGRTHAPATGAAPAAAPFRRARPPAGRGPKLAFCVVYVM